jgi:hypothetical protein
MAGYRNAVDRKHAGPANTRPGGMTSKNAAVARHFFNGRANLTCASPWLPMRRKQPVPELTKARRRRSTLPPGDSHAARRPL